MSIVWVADASPMCRSGKFKRTGKPEADTLSQLQLGSQSLAELREKILRNAAPIARSRAHVVNRRNLSRKHFLSGTQNRRQQPLAAQHFFCFDSAQHRWRYASKCDSNIHNPARLHARCPREAHFRNRLRPPRSHFSVILPPTALFTRQPDSAD